MADELLERLRDSLEGQIVSLFVALPRQALPGRPDANRLLVQDFEGQRLAETLSTVLLSIVGVRSSPPHQLRFPCPRCYCSCSFTNSY
jgi:hypothetical protein